MKFDHLKDISNDPKVVEVFVLLRTVILAQQYQAGPNPVRILMNVADEMILKSIANSSKNPRSSFRVALLQGAHLFLYAILRTVPPGGLLLQTLLTRLHTQLKNLFLNSKSRNQINAWLWLLFVGMLVESSNEASGHSEFTLRLEVFCHAYALEDKGHIVEVLQQFLWLEEACLLQAETFFRRLTSTKAF